MGIKLLQIRLPSSGFSKQPSSLSELGKDELTHFSVCLHWYSDWISVAAVSFDLNRCPKRIWYNKMAPGTRPGVSYNKRGLWSTGCTQAVMVVWPQSMISMIQTKYCLHTRVNTPIILPLNLVCLARGNLDHPNSGSQLLKLHLPECLRRNVSDRADTWC
jgi:hypothetical protein